MEYKKPIPVFLLIGIGLSLIIINIFPFFLPPLSGDVLEDISADFFLSVCAERKSSFDLKRIDDTYAAFSEDRLVSGSRFAYLWIEITNSGAVDREIVLANASRNYYTELLVPEKAGAVTMFRQGDIVPLSESAFRHYKPGFPLVLKAGTTAAYILEFHGPRGLIIAPELLSASTWLDRVSSERSLAGFICGVFIFLLLLNSMNGIALGKAYSFGVTYFIIAVFIFFLRQSRILLLIIDPLIYPEWLYPVSIAFNITGALVFAAVLLWKYYKPWQKLVLRSFAGLCCLLAVVSVFMAPYTIADLLNLLILIALPLMLSGIYPAVKKHDTGVLYIALSFIPWIVMVVVDIISAYRDVRLTMPAEYRQAFGMISSLLFLSVTVQWVHRQRARDKNAEISEELEQARNEMAGQVTSVTHLRTSVLHQVGYQLRQPLDSILALSQILSNEYADPRINAVSKILSAEAGSLKRKIEKEVGNPGRVDLALPAEDDFQDLKDVFEEVPAPRPWINSRVCLYDADLRHSARTVLILRSRGYEVNVMTDQYRILSSVASGKVDVLIVDPTSTGEKAFSLCGLIRGDNNLFEIPILMITNYYDDYIMKKGYASGVNDFLTRPFDSSELAARVQSLIKLKQVAKHNHDLARSEKEKNIFLYFLTHNINTPLTLLLNRVNELSEIEDAFGLDEITDDLLATSREISDIVQNVLISFRLSDGRQTVRLNEVELEPVILAVEKDLSKKAVEKNQQLTVELPDSIPPILGDFTAVRGIIYNLIDNGLKFTQEGGMIRVRVFVADSVTVEISDSGPGIPEAEHDKLFERFECLSTRPTAGESSTGLGLYVANELAIMNGGAIEYEDGDPGACFKLTLPRFYGGDFSE